MCPWEITTNTYEHLKRWQKRELNDVRTEGTYLARISASINKTYVPCIHVRTVRDVFAKDTEPSLTNPPG